MELVLKRSPADGMSVRGTLSPLEIDTLENADYLIPQGTYPLCLTYSPKFRRTLPLVCNVPVIGSGPATLREYAKKEKVEAPDRPSATYRYRTGIRFHPGTRPEHSQGCILVNRDNENRIRELLTTHTVNLKIM